MRSKTYAVKMCQKCTCRKARVWIETRTFQWNVCKNCCNKIKKELKK